jgi:hypothetical protein
MHQTAYNGLAWMDVWSKENKPGLTDGKDCDLSRDIIGILICISKRGVS